MVKMKINRKDIIYFNWFKFINAKGIITYYGVHTVFRIKMHDKNNINYGRAEKNTFLNIVHEVVCHRFIFTFYAYVCMFKYIYISIYTTMTYVYTWY